MEHLLKRSAIALDPKQFSLPTQPQLAQDTVNDLAVMASTSGSGSSIQVYDESGSLVESINGFDFTNAGFSVTPVRISIDPNGRTGWVNGPAVNQLQEFSY